MTAKVIDGKTRAQILLDEVAVGTLELARCNNVSPALAAIIVGDDAASAIYVERKVKTARAVGMRSLKFHLEATVTEDELLQLVDRLNRDPDVHGILVQLPLPPQINRFRVLDAISPAKDVDGFHPVNVGRLARGDSDLVPCTPQGCLMLLDDELPSLVGLHAVVIGCSSIVGQPIAQILLGRGCTVSMAHEHTINLPAHVASADILVVATGVPGLVPGAWLKEGVIVIDVGINRVVDAATGRSRIVGDVRFDEALERARAITPVPGGVGPMTIACLMKNTLIAASRLTAAGTVTAKSVTA